MRCLKRSCKIMVIKNRPIYFVNFKKSRCTTIDHTIRIYGKINICKYCKNSGLCKSYPLQFIDYTVYDCYETMYYCYEFDMESTVI